MDGKDFIENLDFHNESMPIWNLADENVECYSEEQVIWMLEYFSKKKVQEREKEIEAQLKREDLNWLAETISITK